MIKTIDSLIPDIYEVIEGKGGWDATITEFLSEGISSIAENRFEKPQEPRNYLSLSSLGAPPRKLWYKINQPELAEPLKAEALGTFFYGDILEYIVISLAKAAGHKVTGLQEKLEVNGIPGSGDCVIDGVVVDVKSASSFGFKKFKDGKVKEDDPFGYISQLSSYLHAYQDHPSVVTKNKAAFLVVAKDRFKLHLDMYDFTEELKQKHDEVEGIKEMVSGPMPPKCFDAVPDGKSGNMKLATACSYCEYRKSCWPEIRTFLYSTGPRFLTEVNRVPNVPELVSE